MKKIKDKKLILIIVIILLCFSFLTIAFSALSTTMNIDGIGYVRIQTDVRITDVVAGSVSDAITNYDEFSKNTITTGISLNSDTSSVVYEVYVSNYNSNNVGIYSISGLPEGLTYSISDYNVGEGALIEGIGNKKFCLTISGMAGSYDFTLNLDFRSIYTVTYNGFSSTGYPSYIFEEETKIINFSEDVEEVSIIVGGSEYSGYTLSNNSLTLSNITGDVVVDYVNTAKVVLVSGNIDEVGSEVAIGDEHFYVISSTDSTVTMLSKYNLYVGGVYNRGWTAYGAEATGKQDSTMLGYVSGQSIKNGTTVFSSDTQKGTNYSDYSGSIVEGYVNNYKTILESEYGVDVVEARLITKDELTSEEIGCSATDCTCTESAYPWIYSTSYWSGSAGNTFNAWRVSSDGHFRDDRYNRDSIFGVRPVIIISKSNF